MSDETTNDIAVHETGGRLRALFPAAQWLPRYERAWLRHDVVAGITLAAYAIPVSLAYAALAGLPPRSEDSRHEDPRAAVAPGVASG